MDALADISNRTDLSDRDLLRQRAVELLVCGGFRINELMTLPRQIWVEEVVRDENGEPALNPNGQPATRCGLRYWPEKGGSAETQVKWLPSAMVDVARRAVQDILRLTSPAFEVARYQHENPGRTMLGSPWDEMPADHILSAREVGLALRYMGRAVVDRRAAVHPAARIAQGCDNGVGRTGRDHDNRRRCPEERS